MSFSQRVCAALAGDRTYRRAANAFGFAVCAALMGYALYAQFHLHLEPCPLCVFQRIGITALGVIFLIAALQGPRRWGARVYAVLIALAAAATIAVAGRQIYLQHLPPGEVPSCGAPLSVMLQFLPLTAVIRKVLTGSGECGIIDWTFLGLSMAEWVLMWAVVLGVGGVVLNARNTRPPRPD
jgi:disulfide bond formation protein DsbB